SLRAVPPAVPQVPTVGDLSWRHWERDDVCPLAELMRTTQEADGRDWFTSADEIAETFDAPVFDAERDTLVGTSADGVLRAYAQVERFPTDGVTLLRTSVSGGVHPSHRGRGIGTQLLAWATARARQDLTASGADPLLDRLPAR